MYMYAQIFLNKACSVYIMWLVCIFSKLTLCDWTAGWCAPSWASFVFFSQPSSIAYSSLCRVEGLWTFYCMLWHVHKCCPCLGHNLSVILVRLYVWEYIISQETPRFSGSYSLQSSILQSYQNLRCGILCRCSHLALCKFPKKEYLVAVLHSSDSVNHICDHHVLITEVVVTCALVVTNNSLTGCKTSKRKRNHNYGSWKPRQP